MIIHVDARRSQRLPLPILGGATPVRNCDALAIKVTVIARSQPAPGRGLLSRPREVSSGRFSTDLEIQHEGTWTALHGLQDPALPQVTFVIPTSESLPA
jgi:hypothetical protein